MSQSVDQRIVSLKFNNSDFEKNAQSSLSTLDKLREKLSFSGASKGLNDLGETVRKTEQSTSGFERSVESVNVKFSALEVMAVTALTNIANRAIASGEKIVKALTIEPIKMGFEEYELKMNSVQTIMSGSGESLDTVNKYLQELNLYADRTIYSFSDMTQNIGKFTNAGVNLEDAVMAIKGVSNEAARSGANANEASRAMYNFAQALSAGHVKLIDWKSIENANMATVEFKNYLLEAAAACGTLEKTSDGMYRVLSTNSQNKTFDELIDATHNFNDSLNYQWMTTESLINTLKDYGDETTEIGKLSYEAASKVTTLSKMFDTLKEAAQSGWSESWEIIVGNYDEASKLWTAMNDSISGMIGRADNARNIMLSGIFDTPWTAMSTMVRKAGGDVEDFQNTVAAVGIEMGVLSEESIEAAGGIDKAISASKETIEMVKEAIGRMANNTEDYSDDQIESLRALQDEIDRTGGPIDNLILRMDQMSGRELVFDIITQALQGVEKVLQVVNKSWKSVFPENAVEPAFNFLVKVLDVVRDSTGYWSDGAFYKAMEKVQRILTGVFSVLKLITSILSGGLKIGIAIINGLLGTFGVGLIDISAGAGDLAVAFANWVEQNKYVTKTVENVTNAVRNAFTWIHETGIESGWLADKISKTKLLINAIGEALKALIIRIKDLYQAFVESPQGQKAIRVLIDGLQLVHKWSVKLVDTTGAFIDSGFNRLIDYLDNFTRSLRETKESDRKSVV